MAAARNIRTATSPQMKGRRLSVTRRLSPARENTGNFKEAFYRLLTSVRMRLDRVGVNARLLPPYRDVKHAPVQARWRVERRPKAGGRMKSWHHIGWRYNGDMRRSNAALRLQASLLDEVRRVAETEGVALNQFINVAAAEKLSAIRTGDYFRERAERAGRGNAPAPGDELE